MLRQQFKLSSTLLMTAALIFFLWSIYDYMTNRNLFESMLLLLYGVVLFFTGIIAYGKMKRTALINHVEDIYHHKKFIIEKEVSLYNQLLIYSPDGNVLGRYKPLDKGIKNKLFGISENFIRVLPFPHVIEDMNGREIVTIDIKGMKDLEFTVYDNSQEIGRIKQRPLKSLTKYVFEVTTKDGIITTQSEAIIGDLKIPGIVNIYTDKVPLYYSRTFNQLTLEVSEIEDDLSTVEGKIGLAMSVIYKSLRTK